MRTFIAIITGLCLTGGCAAAEFNPFEGPRPMVILIQTNPWGIIGADTPDVAVYENGDVIFAKQVKDRRIYHHVVLDQDSLERVRKQIEPLLALTELKPWYNFFGATDQPTARFYLRDRDHEVATSVYGLRAGGTGHPAFTEYLRAHKLPVTPDELLTLHKWLSELDYPNSEEWTPRYVEVMLWEDFTTPEASIQWPKDWPSLNSDRARQRGDQYSIFLDGALLSKLQEFLATWNGNGAVGIGGKNWLVSYRFTFPGELDWRAAFAAASKRNTVADQDKEKAQEQEKRAREERKVAAEVAQRHSRAWQECQHLKGYATLRKSFEVEDANLGSINMFPESLHVTLRTTNSGLLNAAWWWDPLDKEGNPTYDWDAFLQVYAEAAKVVAKHTWLLEWRDASPGRLVELHAFGKGIGEIDSDLTDFILPLWREAGFAGQPAYSLLLRRGNMRWATLYFGIEETRALVASVSEPEDAPAHWLDGLRVFYHPRCKVGEQSSRYVVVQPSGEWELRTVGKCDP